MQDKLNQSLFPDWKYRSLDWNTAILVESGELVDHLAWKWWKKGGTSDLNQARMEVVDIWHFLLSRIGELRSPQELEELAADVAGYFAAAPAATGDGLDASSVVASTKRFTSSMLSSQSDATVLWYFTQLMFSLGMGFDDLYRMYIGKGVLNQFRWANGYGSTYIKDWLGEEDNEYLTRVMGELNPTSETFSQDLRAKLEARYAEVTA